MELLGELTVAAIKRRMREELARAAPLERIDDRLTWLADETKDAYKNVQRWINGSVEPPPDFVVRFCDATGRSLDYIMAGREPRESVPPERAALALSIIETVTEASADAETFERFYGYWEAFKRLPKDDGQQGEA